MPMVQISCDLEDDLDQRLRLYMRATRLKLANVVRPALEFYIANELRLNRGIRARYAIEEAKLLKDAGVIQLRPRRRPRRKASSGGSAPQNTEAAE